MRIGLDLLHALPEIGGGWNYIARLVAALGQHDTNNTYIAFVTEASACLVPASPHFHAVHVPIEPRARARRVLYENTMLQVIAKKHKVDCMHWFANTQGFVNSVPALVTIYDLQPFRQNAEYSWYKRLYLQAGMRQTMRHARLVLPMSASTRDALCMIGADRSKMVVIPAIVDDRFVPCSPERVERLRSRYALPTAFWLYVAHFYPHKNHVRLLKAYSLLRERGKNPWPLILRGDDAGAGKGLAEMIQRLSLQDSVRFLPRLEEDELPVMYSAATAMVYPTLYEGGGMPLPEALACGCPVAASDIPTTREFAGDAALLYDPTDVEAIASAMHHLQSSEDECRTRSQRGLAQVTNQRPERVCKILCDAYAIAVSGHRL
ncbi:MAG: glycosyltransferase family 4 protein [Anaerolineae bacterium]